MIDEKVLMGDIKNKISPEKFGESCNALDVIYAFLQLIEEQEKVDEWIPCSEKLPVSDGRFEVTIKGRSGKSHVEMCNFHKDAKFTSWGLDNWEHGNVIAWRQRPKPYKEG